MCAIAHFFREDVTWVDDTRDVVEIHLFGLNDVVDITVFKVDAAHALAAGALGPVHGVLIVVIEAGRAVGVWEIHGVTVVAEGDNFLAACALFAHCLPGDGAATPHGEEASHCPMLKW